MSVSDSTSIIAVEYRDIPDFPGYRIGNDGSVWSCWYKISHGRPLGIQWYMGAEWHRMAFSIDHGGYRQVGLSRDGKRHCRKVHRLVAERFIGPRPAGMQIRHLDGTRTNNTPANLSYGTAIENQADRIVHGTDCRGEKQGASKLTKNDVIAIRDKFAAGVHTKQNLADEYHVSDTQIGRIINRTKWKCVT
jgi:hypothetical protein